VNADRLVRLVAEHAAERVRAYWSSVAVWLGKDRRLARLLKAYGGAPVDLLSTGNAFQLARRGADERFTSSKLRVPRGTLRDRPDDVLTPEALVRRHASYRNRVLMGPTWRADVWTVLERDPELAVAEALRQELGGRDQVHVSLSHQVVGTFREFERASTTEVDAALSPLLGGSFRR